MDVADAGRVRPYLGRVLTGITGVGQDAGSQTLSVQLTGAEDASVLEDESAQGRWRAYVASYVMNYPTERVPSGSAPVLLRRCVSVKLRTWVRAPD